MHDALRVRPTIAKILAAHLLLLSPLLLLKTFAPYLAGLVRALRGTGEIAQHMYAASSYPLYSRYLMQLDSRSGEPMPMFRPYPMFRA